MATARVAANKVGVSEVLNTMMFKIRNLVILGAFSFICVHEPAQARKKVRLDEQTLKTLKENFRIFTERNAMRLAQQEISQQIVFTPDVNHVLLQEQKNLVMPICDTERPPFEWSFVAPSDDQIVLRYTGNRKHEKRVRWLDSIWIKSAGPLRFDAADSEKRGEVMTCGVDGNFVNVDVDNSIGDGVLMQLGNKVISPSSQAVKAELRLSATPSLANAHVGLEIWTRGANGPKLIASTWERIGSTAQMLRAEGSVDAKEESFAILKLDKESKEKAAAGNLAGQVTLFDARLQREE
jgi:hypothetical protein